MHRCRQNMVPLPVTASHRTLFQYAGMFAEMGAGVEFRFVTMLPAEEAAPHTVDRDRLLPLLEAEIQRAFADVSAILWRSETARTLIENRQCTVFGIW